MRKGSLVIFLSLKVYQNQYKRGDNEIQTSFLGFLCNFVLIFNKVLTTFVGKRKNDVNSLKILMNVDQHTLFRYTLRNFGVIVLVSELQAAQNRQFSTKKRAKILLQTLH